jgi:hypothetical protein
MVRKNDFHRKSIFLDMIRKYCLSCGDGTRTEARRCTHKDCPLWPYRRGVAEDDESATDIFGAIMAHCTLCMGGNSRAVRNCPCERCHLSQKEL